MDFFTRKTTVLDSGLLTGAADRHSHILWGIDDGVKTFAETLEILSFLGECGLGDLWLTPHTAEDVPNTTERLKARFAELQAIYQVRRTASHLYRACKAPPGIRVHARHSL